MDPFYVLTVAAVAASVASWITWAICTAGKSREASELDGFGVRNLRLVSRPFDWADDPDIAGDAA